MVSFLRRTWRQQGRLGKALWLLAGCLALGCPCGLLASLAPSPATPTPAATAAPAPSRALLSLALASTTAPPPTPTLQPTHTPSPTATLRPTDTPTPTPALTPTPVRVSARVVQVVDGDTIVVEVDGTQYPLRYIGMDAPERAQTGTGLESLAAEATAKNQELVGGKTVYLEKDVSETDKYGRLLRYVYVGDLFVNAELVRLGYAQAVTYPPDVKHQALLLQMQSEAQEAGRGLWGLPPTATPPPATPAPAPVCDCSSNRYNCADFATHAAAQACFDYCKSIGAGDVHHLDRDNDGSACETLP